mgnify:CR=1 FL=1
MAAVGIGPAPHQRRWRIEGMDCAGCARTIEQALARLEGVEDIKLAYATGLLEARVGAAEHALEVEVRLDRLGYTALPLESTSAGTVSTAADADLVAPASASAGWWWRDRKLRPVLVTGGLVLIVISMVIPLPPSVLDFGFALSIAAAVLVLVMASLVDRPTDFQAFPMLLLMTLVIRLSLNVSSTRLILTQGHTGTDAAGHIINGFASFVAGGSLMVGLTVFAVISIVNFMVITKGSGRMAEVSARFALDSLPGKQLAIDGDLNSGAIDHQEAKNRRLRDQQEINFFGSLDGASKFVKGDAVAGIVITLVNLLVGLGIGIVAHKMPVGQAMATYSHLTIGDGLVGQIPAVITSMAAALLLSRGGATDTTTRLLSSQLIRSWQPAAVVAAAMLLMSFVPGMPRVLFLAIAAALALGGWHLHRKAQAAAIALPDLPAETAASRPAARIGDVLDTDEISVEIDPGKTLEVRLLTLGETDEKGEVKVFFELNGQPRQVRVPNRKATGTKAARPKADPANAGHVGAPMPGVVASVAASAGSKVRQGDLLLTIEAMKMETGLHADRDGTIKAIHVRPGEQIDAKDLLVEVE